MDQPTSTDQRPTIRRRGRTFFAIAVMAVSAAGLAGCGDDDSADTSSATTAEPATDDTAPAGGDTAGGETTVDIVSVSDGFEPATATVAVGDGITWVNTDEVTHTTTAEDGTWDSGDMAGGDEFTFTAEEAGTYAYVCDIHPSMTGEIVVE